jgi:hypothetical protein
MVAAQQPQCGCGEWHGPRMPANIETWKQRGYTIHVMAGIG